MALRIVAFFALFTVLAQAESSHKILIEVEKYKITIDTSETPDLCGWAADKLQPVVKEWYPKLVEMLPGEEYEAPTEVSITVKKESRAIASASGNRITCQAEWFRKNLNGEAVGAVVHEMVHVVQNYGWGRRRNPEAKRTPGWIVEGIPDYIRWFLYEPETKGAEITERNLSRAKYDANYRITGNFIDWVVRTYDKDKDLVRKLNAEARAGRYSDDLWKEYTGKTVQELGAEWKEMHEKRLKKETDSKSSEQAP